MRVCWSEELLDNTGCVEAGEAKAESRRGSLLGSCAPAVRAACCASRLLSSQLLHRVRLLMMVSEW